MDISDLRAELHRRAAQVPPAASTQARLAAVARRVRARRQRVVGGVTALAAAGVAIGATFVPDLTGNTTTEVEPAAPSSTQSTMSPVGDGLGSWPSRVDGNPLVVDRLTRQSVHTRTWAVTAPTLDLSVSVFCRLQPGLAREDEALSAGPVVFLSVNGHSDIGVSCGDSDTLDAQRPIVDLNPKNLRDYGVHAGETFDVTLRVGRERHVPVWRAQLGLGLYARTGDVRQVAPGWSIPVVRGVPGEETSLFEVFKGPVRRSGGVLDVTLGQSGDSASELSFGWLVGGHRGSAVLIHDGVYAQRSTAGGITSGVPVQDGHRIVVRTHGGVARGTLMLAMYEPLASSRP